MMSLEFENLENITKQLWGAANSRSICSLKLEGENGYRMIHTHGDLHEQAEKINHCMLAKIRVW